jgi:hypothetical protein
VSAAARRATVQAMHRAGLRAPLPCDTPERIAAGGQCFTMDTPTGQAVMVLRRDGDVLWIDGAAAVVGDGHTATGLQLCQEIARQAGCTWLAFETNRPGLVRAAEPLGFEVAGFIMKSKV